MFSLFPCIQAMFFRGQSSYSGARIGFLASSDTTLTFSSMARHTPPRSHTDSSGYQSGGPSSPVSSLSFRLSICCLRFGWRMGGTDTSKWSVTVIPCSSLHTYGSPKVFMFRKHFRNVICAPGSQRAGHILGEHIGNWQHAYMYPGFVISGERSEGRYGRWFATFRHCCYSLTG